MSAQVPLSCEFCEESADIRWFCYDCILHLCEKCKLKLHSRIKSAQKHKVVDIQSKVNPENINTSDTENTMYVSVNGDVSGKKCHATGTCGTEELLVPVQIPCKTHKGQHFCFFCKDCDEFLCPTCHLKQHIQKFKDHIILEIPEAFVEKRDQVRSKVNHVKNKVLQDLKNEKEFLVEISKVKDEQIESERAKIITRTEEVTSLVKNYSVKLLDQLNSERNENETFKTRTLHTLDTFENTVNEVTKQAERALHMNDVEGIFALAKTFEQKTIFVRPQIIRSNQYFASLEISESNIKQFFGSLVKLKVIKTYKTDFPVVQILKTVGSSLWISNDEKKILRKVNHNDEVLQSVYNLDGVQIVDIAPCGSKDIILKFFRSDKLEFLSNEEKWKDFCDMAPMIPLSVHVLQSGNVLVGLKESTGENYITTEQSRRQLVLLSHDGQRKRVYEYNNHNERLFTYIFRITSTLAGDICVIDRLSNDFRGRVVMLKQTDSVFQWIYTGFLNDKNKDTVFKPMDIVTTNLSNIIVSDRSNNLLHVLSGSNGNVLTLVNTLQLGIQLPHSLDIDDSSTLWIGCSIYQGEPDEAKIHSVRFSGF